MPDAAEFDRRAAAISRFAHAGTSGALLEITVGVEIFSKDRRNADDYGLGGVVLECHAGASGIDRETGEFVERPAWYTVYDRQALPGHHVRQITEPEIDRDGLTTAQNLGWVVRALAGELAVYKQARGKRRHGSATLSSYELDICRWLGALGKVIGGNVMAAVEVARPQQRKDEDDSEF